MRMTYRITMSVMAAAMVAVSLQTALAGVERFTAQAVNMSNVGRPGAGGTIEILINRFSTASERRAFLVALQKGGNDGLLRAFQAAPSLGKIGPTGRVGFDIRYAHEMAGEDGGRQVVIASDRRMSFFEASARPRTVDYPFTVVQLQLDNDGNGEGKASLLTRIEVDEQRQAIVLENFASQPVDLMTVRSLGGNTP